MYQAYVISASAVDVMRWILLCNRALGAGRPSFSAKVYTLACLSSWSPLSSTAGVEESDWSVPVGSLCGRYSPA